MSENLYVELSDRSKQIFKSVVETYLETGSPSGSETHPASILAVASRNTIGIALIFINTR